MTDSSALMGKKVLHVLDRSVPDLSGYSIRSKYILEHQAKAGLAPVAVTSPLYQREQSREEIGGVCYYRSSSEVARIHKFLLSVPVVKEQMRMSLLSKKLQEIVRTTPIDVIHAHSPSLCGLPAMRVARKFGLPFVYEVRALWEDAAVDRRRFGEQSLKYRISRSVEQRIFDRADALVCICEGLKQELAARAEPAKIFVVQNGVDTDVFHASEKATGLIQKYGLETKTVIGFIGSFFTFEGLGDLIQSMPIVAQQYDNVVALIVGGGVEEASARSLAEQLGVLNRTVIFTGKVAHEEIQDYYSVVDILVYPRMRKRITELVTPLKPLEAMAMEKAVLASDVGGLKELIQDGVTGLLFRAGDVQDLAEKIITLAKSQDARTRMGKEARVHMKRYREWARIIPEYFAIYSSAITRAGKRLR